MDISALKDLIGSFGFPIIACIFMYFEMSKTRQSHAEEMKLMTEALNNNTNVLERLVAKIGI